MNLDVIQDCAPCACGHHPKLHSNARGSWYVQCPACGYSPTGVCTNPGTACDAWNEGRAEQEAEEAKTRRRIDRYEELINKPAILGPRERTEKLP